MELGINIRNLYWLLGALSKVSTDDDKLLLYRMNFEADMVVLYYGYMKDVLQTAKWKESIDTKIKQFGR